MDADDADIVEMASELEYELLEDDVDQPLVSLPPAPSSSDAAPKAQMGKPVQDRGAKQEPSPPSPPNAAEMAAPKKRARTRAHSETSRASASIGSTPATSSAAADGKQSPPPVAEMSSNLLLLGSRSLTMWMRASRSWRKRSFEFSVSKKNTSVCASG